MIYEDENLSYYWHEGILICDWKFSHANFELVDFGVQKRLEITGTKPCVMISDIRSLKTATREARQRMSGKDASFGLVAVGIVVSSNVQSVIYNFFKEVYHLPAPTKTFTDRNKAIAWCKKFVPKED